MMIVYKISYLIIFYDQIDRVHIDLSFVHKITKYFSIISPFLKIFSNLF